MVKQAFKKKGGKPDGRRKLDAGKVLELAQKGVSQTDIAKSQGVAVSSVSRFLDKHGPEARALAEYKDNRMDWLHALSKQGSEILFRLLDSIASEDLEKTSLAERKELVRVLGTLFGIAQDKIAALEGKVLGGGMAVQVVINTTPEALGMEPLPAVEVQAVKVSADSSLPGGQD